MGESNSEIIGAQLATLFGIIVILVITGCVAGNRAFTNIEEPFSPLGFTADAPPFQVPINKSLHVKGCGPGCWELKSGSTKENFYSANKSHTTDKVPDFAKQLPIGHLSTMGSPLTGQASCTSNVNNVQKLGNSNPYGELVKKYGTDQHINQFTQSYAACEFGSNNIFDKNQLKY